MDRNMPMAGRLTRRSPSPSRGGGGSKLRMDRKPNHVRITDPSHPAGKRKEIDNVMRKARAFPNETWDKKLLEAEEKDPNRWRHTGFKKMYIEDDASSSDSDSGGGGGQGRPPPPGSRYGNGGGGPPSRRSRSPRSRSPLPPPPRHRRSPSPPMRAKRRFPVSPSPPPERRPPPPRPMRRGPSPMGSPPPPSAASSGRSRQRMSPMPLPPRGRPKRPPSPPPKMNRSPSVSSCSEESCSGCSMDDHRRRRSRSRSLSGPPPPRARVRGASPPPPAHLAKSRRPMSPPPTDPRRKEPLPKVHRVDKDPRDRPSRPIPPPPPPERVRRPQTPEMEKAPPPKVRVAKHKQPIPEDPRPAKARVLKQPPPEVAAAAAPPATSSKKHKEKAVEKHLRARVKIEGEPKPVRRPRSPSSGSEESSSSESSLPRFTATTRLTLSERFGKMAQWSVDRSNMENMRITKNSSGGDLKVMIEEEMEAPPPTRFTYSPAPAGHFPEELMTTGPTGLSSWDDVRVRYEYYKGRGYLRDLDLEDYVKWEEWWYKYQEWLKQERYYEMWERSRMNRHRKKVPIAQRLN